MACMEIAKMCTEDKILQIYFLGLKILRVAFAPPVCGTDVSPQLINKALKEFLPILLSKIEELNSRARDVSLNTLLSLFQHPAAQIGMLVSHCISLFSQENVALTGKPIVSADKQPFRIVMARLDILLNLVRQGGYDPAEYSWEEVVSLLCIPSLFHQNNEIR